MERQFTATVYIIEGQRTLLIYHRKLQKWLPPGGHLEANETPPEAARREALEETGVEITFMMQENVWIDRWNAKSFERPYLCLLEEIPAFGSQPAHQHVDFIYVATPSGGQETLNAIETDGIRWFSIEEIEELVPDEEIFVETQQTLRSIFSSPSFVRSGAFFVPVVAPLRGADFGGSGPRLRFAQPGLICLSPPGLEAS